MIALRHITGTDDPDAKRITLAADSTVGDETSLALGPWRSLTARYPAGRVRRFPSSTARIRACNIGNSSTRCAADRLG